MLQAQFIHLVIALSGITDAAQIAVENAASAWMATGLSGARDALHNAGYFPFSVRVVSDQERADALGLTHCAALPKHEQMLCARLVARVRDQSPVHVQVDAAPGYRVMHAHVVFPDGATRKLHADAAGIFDWPAQTMKGSWSFGVSVSGPAGPETGVFMRFGYRQDGRDACLQGTDFDGLLAVINDLRMDLGRQPLKFALAPPSYARQRGRELAVAFGHSPLGLASLLRPHRQRVVHAAEVVAEDPSVPAICRGWLLSPAHRAALIDDRRDRIAFVQQGDRVAALLWARVLPVRRASQPSAVGGAPPPL